MPITTGPKRKKKPGPSIMNSNTGGNFTESAMDDYLSKQGLYRKPIAKDGSCLFRAVSEQVHNCQARHLDVRNKCIEFMRRNRQQFEEFVEGPFDHHLFKLQNPKEWAGQVEITALSKMFRKDFVVYQDINAPPTKVTDHGYKEKILLCYSNGNHYDIIYDSHYKEHAAMCQSFLFELLYNRVFATLDKKEKKGRPKVNSSPENQKNIMDLMNGGMIGDKEMLENTGNDDGWTEVKSKSRVKHERYSKSNEPEEEKEPEVNKNTGNNDQKNLWELRRSVDPHLYRNIPLENWEEDKHVLQQKDMAVAASIQYKNGERCSVKLGPPLMANEKLCTAIIKEDYSGSGNILVYVPELNKRHTVPIQSVSSHQGPSYKELSGHYQKDNFSANGPATEEASKDDGKFKKKRPPRNRRGPGKSGDEPGNVNEELQQRGRGKPRDRNRHRFPGRKDDRNFKDDEEAKFIAEQIKLVELQEKDTTSFPALPVRTNAQTSPTSTAPSLSAVKPENNVEISASPIKEPKSPEPEKEEPAVSENTPAGFWSNFTKKKVPRPAREDTKLDSNNAPTTAKQPEADITQPLNEELHVDEGNEIPAVELLNKDYDDQEIVDAEQASEVELNEALTIKPVIEGDTSGPAFEAKSPDANILKQVKLTPEVQGTQPPEIELKQLKINDKEMEEKRPLNIEDVVDYINKIRNEKTEDKQEVNDSKNNDKNEQVGQIEVASSKNTLYLEKTYPQEMFSHGEQTLKPSKPLEHGVTPERKTVTFADETKEIPDVPYGQTQKGILVVNGSRTEQGFKPASSEEYSTAPKDTTKQDFVVQEAHEKDPQMFPSVIASEGMQSSSPTAQQQMSPYGFFMPPNLPSNVQLPPRASMDPNGSDLPQDIPTLRHFFNLGYQTYCQMLTVNQMASQQLPFMYMYQPGAIQEQLIQQAAQPVVSLPHQPMYGGLQHQHTSYQPHGIQNYAPFHMPPPTSQDSVAQHDRTPERNTQPQVQPQQQIQLPHQQQSGHFQQQQQQPSHMQWRNNNPQQTNRHKFQHHNMGNQAHRPTTWSTGTNQRQPHSNPNKQNRKPQSAKIRSDYYPQHYNNTAHAQSMAHNAAALNTSYYSPGEHHSKTLNTPENMYYMPYSAYSSGTTHHAGPRANNY